MLSRGETPQRPMSTIKDRKDTRRRLDLADRFSAIYDKEWKAAFQELTSIMRWRELECIYALMRVVRVSLNFDRRK